MTWNWELISVVSLTIERKFPLYLDMTARQLLEDLYKSKELKECLAKIRPVEVQQDVLQHTFTELLLKDESFILDIWNRGKLTAYVAKMLYNMANLQRSSFNYPNRHDYYPEHLPEVVEVKEEKIDVPLDKLYWYEAEILKLYAEHGSYRKVEELTGISHVSVYNTVKKARINIKKKMDL